jgi:ADP-dependent NAD(P)H-hydrate dehydratase / NAD(P)H-hydrate epimerase
MLKILTTKQIKALDAYTIKHRPIDSIDLMEKACHEVSVWLMERYNSTYKIGIVCGTGNNGGDGLGVARMLNAAGYLVTVWIVKGGVAESADFQVNLSRLQGKIEPTVIADKLDAEIFSKVDILLDAVFGSGLSRPAEGIYAKVIHAINQASALRIAIDIPSGLMADKPSDGAVVKASQTLTFQLPKLAFLFPQHHEFVGNWTLLDIGLHKDFIKGAETSHYYFVRKDVRKILRPRSKFDHKGLYGHALLIAGGYGKMGAAVLSTRSALRSGLGLLTVHVPGIGYSIIQTTAPEAMVSIDPHQEFLTQCPKLENYNVVGIGPGLGQDKQTVKAFGEILQQCEVPMVIDADGLNMMAAHREFLQIVPGGSILTPHPKEFERLVGKWKNDFDRLEKQQKLASDLKSVIVLKGAYTSVVSAEGNVYFNSSGNAGMAKGGLGDVLTGILTGLLAQQYTAIQAAQVGVFIHGFSGDLAAYEKGRNSLIASDVIEFLPEAFKRVC